MEYKEYENNDFESEIAVNKENEWENGEEEEHIDSIPFYANGVSDSFDSLWEDGNTENGKETTDGIVLSEEFVLPKADERKIDVSFTDKQLEYLRHPPQRWNIKTGATRSGKTFIDLYVIPLRIAVTKGRGLIVFIGATVGTVCRNIINPMRRIWGDVAVGYLQSDLTVNILGKKCYIIGASRADQVDKIRGASVEYCYGDEITTWDKEVFDMLKSRLDSKRAVFDGTCNPEGPNHWFKRFLESGADIFHQHYTIYDNPRLDEEFVKNLEIEYKGTVLFDRYILGKWTAGQGAIYPLFAENPQRYRGETNLGADYIGIDFGGTRSSTAFVACAYDDKTSSVYVKKSSLISEELDCLGLCRCFEEFYREIGSPECTVYCDSAEPILIRSLRHYAWERGLPVSFRPAQKGLILNRIITVNSLISRGRLFLGEECGTLEKALITAEWKNGGERDERRDDGTSDVDSLDAFEYCIEKMHLRITEG